jgi:hypothetical protein
MLHARPLFSSENVSRCGGEEIARFFCVGGLRALVTSMTTSTPTSASSRPSPVDTSTPRERASTARRVPLAATPDRGSPGDTRPADNCNTHRTPPLGLIAIAQDSELQLSG